MRLIQILLLTLLIACQRMPSRPGYPVTPQVAVESTYKVEQWLNARFTSSGTAWIVDTDGKQTYLMSAGHVCEPDGQGFAVFKLIDRFGKETWARAWVRSEDPDLCVLIAEGDLGRPLLLADELPEYGSPIMYVGAPMGMYGNGLAPIFDGRYMGWRGITAPTIGGASGAPIFTQEGVFGVLVMVDKRFHHVTWMVPLQEIRDFLYRNGLHKFTPSQKLLDELQKAEDTEREQTD